MVPAPSSDPIQQIQGLPVKLCVQSYFNRISEEDFQSSMKELQESRRQYLRTINSNPVPPSVADAEMVVISSDTLATEVSPAATYREERRPIQQNLQRHPNSTTVATVPIILNNTIFEEGIIDTGATNTMISQSAARQLGMLNEIEPCRLKFSCADGKMSAPWGIIRRLPG